MSNQGTDDDGRRKFFRQLAERLVDPVAGFIEKKAAFAAPRSVLRPPGAIAEPAFNETCQRCGECVRVCPASAIHPLGSGFAARAGSPTVNPASAPCVICEGLLCTHVCPSGALLPVYQPHLIAMGTAEVYESVCVRTRGESCTVCVDRCPLGEAAIGLDGDGPPVVATGCVGCGVCEFYCPTQPKAITVKLA